MDLGEDLPGCIQKKFVFQERTFLEAYEKKNELKSVFDKFILVTQAAGGQKSMQAAKQTRLNVR